MSDANFKLVAEWVNSDWPAIQLQKKTVKFSIPSDELGCVVRGIGKFVVLGPRDGKIAVWIRFNKRDKARLGIACISLNEKTIRAIKRNVGNDARVKSAFLCIVA